MDTKWLITIVIANVIAAIVKELVTGVIKRMPSTTATLTAKLKPIVTAFLRKYWRMLVDLVGMVVVIIGFRFVAPTLGPVTHGTVFVVGMFAAWFIYWQFELVKDLRKLTDTG